MYTHTNGQFDYYVWESEWIMNVYEHMSYGMHDGMRVLVFEY